MLQRSRTLPKQHLVNIQIPGNSSSPWCHPGFLRKAFSFSFPGSVSQHARVRAGLCFSSWLEGRCWKGWKDMGTLQHLPESQQWDKLPVQHTSISWMQGSAWQHDPWQGWQHPKTSNETLRQSITFYPLFIPISQGLPAMHSSGTAFITLFKPFPNPFNL